MKKNLYFCSTYYHVLIAIVRVLYENDTADIFVTNYIPNNMPLSDRLEKSGIFNRVFVVEKNIEEFSPKNLIQRVFFRHKKNIALIESQIRINLKEYNKCFVFHDGTWMAHYLQDKKKRYVLMEDALNSFESIKKTTFSHLVQKDQGRIVFKNAFGIGYNYLGKSRYTYQVDVNDKNEIGFISKRKIVENPREIYFSTLTEENLLKLKKIFSIEKFEDSLGRVSILLTQPLVEDKYVNTEEEQLLIYKKIVSQFIGENKPFYIKPHPRDKIEYEEVFPQAVVLDKFVPVEMYNYLNISFEKSITLFSTSNQTMKKAQENINIIDVNSSCSIKNSIKNLYL